MYSKNSYIRTHLFFESGFLLFAIRKQFSDYILKKREKYSH